VFSFYEFFAGGGMARAGLGTDWTCAFANDFNLLKADTYKKNFGCEKFVFGDIHDLGIDDLQDEPISPGHPFRARTSRVRGQGWESAMRERALERVRERSGLSWL
jgi:DNA (cytosine-5)-methyltransferase 1